MISYLLLRSNKENGPFSLDELVAFGLKPYDLVWVNGKSAAWRYPSEVDELKPFAPAVEEQPFDRFYKKPTPVQQETTPVMETTLTNESPYQPKVVEKLAGSTPNVFAEKKNVFVTLPVQRTAGVQTPPAKALPKKSLSTAALQLENGHDDQPTIKITENTDSAQIKFSQPLDDIKEMYVKTLQDRKSRIARRGYMAVHLKRAAVVVGLVGAGVLAGFIIKPRGKDDGKQISPQTNVGGILSTDHVAETPAASVQDPLMTDPIGDKSTAATKSIDDTPIDAKTNLPVRDIDLADLKKPHYIKLREETLAGQKTTASQKTLLVPPVLTEKQAYTAAGKDVVTGERNKAVRDDNNSAMDQKQPRAVMPGGLQSQVTVSSNDYKRVAFGGIRNLRLTVTNNSKYELENVVVELQYLKPSEEPLRTDNIEFKGIGPNESSTIRIPDTNRGIKVNYRIVRIGSKQQRDEVAGR